MVHFPFLLGWYIFRDGSFSWLSWRGPNAHQISIILSVIQMHKIIELLMVSKLMVKVESSSSRCVFLEYSYISNCWGATQWWCCSCLIDSDLSKSRLFWFRISISFFLPFTHEPPYISSSAAHSASSCFSHDWTNSGFLRIAARGV